MKDTHKHLSEQQEFSSDISAEKSTQEIQEKLWTELLKTALFAFMSLFVIVSGSIAWFVSNSRVDSGEILISHHFDTIRLATKGERQQAEEKLLMLDEGIEFVDTSGKIYYYTESGEIALCLSDSLVEVSPGMSGEISFYIIPNRTGSQTVTLHLGLAGYEETTVEGGSNTGRKIDDLVLNSLLSGHILLFQSYESGQYDDWLPGSVSTGGVDYQVTVTNPDAVADVPWEITIYWVWPLRYKNMNADYNGLLDAFIEAQATDLPFIDGTSYRYSQIFLTKDENLDSVDSRSNAYNQADEYIGTKANYLYVTVQTDLVN